ncbi:MAG TPA: bifunctional phosphopantothenoylcysteine decarboxylase/phosphopantothenate--cysteine ligase CoaBC [Acidimicrobiaceae bacterium]|nr:bifunctional phosphopantothenoylcysteine decarboxylase/phosphopantothenate--cysteine ligase CoaBC [Acidimicrobiaceae bacterium]HCB37301.1 bifunctional phosphopantothenoylcysteine decarboxylase/phosphopantothenate--cysteine ligase CoaBC [Acidimicrobiaceae bacterium]
MLKGKRIVLGVSGGIAAYKAVLLCRLLVDAEAHVIPVMTDAAQRFVGRATFDALASERVQTTLFGESDPIPHTRLGRSADLVVVAPATARLIGAYAAGISDDLLTATLLATRAPVVLCPAMHTEMWEHPAVADNLALLARRGVHIVEPAAGRLAGGDVGTGRLAEPRTILKHVRAVLAGVPGGAGSGGDEVDRADRADAPRSADLAGRTVVVTAGGTREAIDPVRFVGNRSSGRQGHALAEAAAARGAAVTLITAAALPPPDDVHVVNVVSAAEMDAAVSEHAPAADAVVMAAAVADFRPADPAAHKIKKADGAPHIELVPTVDILAGLGERKPAGQVLVGFAAETRDAVSNAAAKLTEKNLDLVVVNDVAAPGAGFEHPTNAVTILRAGTGDAAGTADAGAVEVALTSKLAVAHAVLDEVAAVLAGEGSPPGAGAGS